MSSSIDVEEKAQQLHNILTQSKNKEEDMIAFDLTLDRDQRLSVRRKYEEMFTERPLIEDFKKYLSRDFKDLNIKLYMGRAELDAYQLQRCMNFFTKDPGTVYEIALARPAWLKNQMKDVFLQVTGNDLEKELESFAPSAVKKPLMTAFRSERKGKKIADHDKCQKDALKLASTKVENWITTDEIINGIFLESSPEELVLTSRYFFKKSGSTILESVDSLNSAQKKFFEALLYNVINPPELFARRMYEAVKGLGTDTNLLERIVASRYDLDMFIIKKYYYQFYKVALKEDLAADISGNYLKLVESLINLQSPEDY